MTLHSWITEDLSLRIWELECLMPHEHTVDNLVFSYRRWNELRDIMRITSFPYCNFNRHGTSGITSPEPIWIQKPPKY